MNIPPIDPEPSEEKPITASLRSRARRRHRLRVIEPIGAGERTGFLYELSRRVIPSADFYLYSLLAGLVLAAALAFDSLPLLFLAALVAPFMAPVIGGALGTVSGAARYWLQSLGSLLVGGLIIFFTGMLGGWAAALLPARSYYLLSHLATLFTWAGFLMLTAGAALTTYQMARSPAQRPLVASAAVAYSLYTPLGAAGFGLATGYPDMLLAGLLLFAVCLIWALLVSTLVFTLLGVRPLTGIGYILGACYSLTGILALAVLQLGPANPLALFVSRQVGSAFFPPTEVLSANLPVVTASPTFSAPTSTATITPAPTRTHTPSPIPATPTITSTPTRTLVPSRTPTVTITPQPTPIWGIVKYNTMNGIVIRKTPSYDTDPFTTVLSGTLVEIFPGDEIDAGNGETWVHVRTAGGIEGWVQSILLTTATPVP